MTTKEAIYLLRNTAWLAPSLEPIDEAVEMVCEALDKVEYINSQLGKPKDEPQNDCSECGMRNPYIGSGDTALLSNPHNWAGSKYCPNCGADMRGERSGTDKDKFEQ